METAASQPARPPGCHQKVREPKITVLFSEHSFFSTSLIPPPLWYEHLFNTLMDLLFSVRISVIWIIENTFLNRLAEKMQDWQLPLCELVKGRLRITKSRLFSKVRRCPGSPQRKCMNPWQAQTKKIRVQGQQRLLSEGVYFVIVEWLWRLNLQE